MTTRYRRVFYTRRGLRAACERNNTLVARVVAYEARHNEAAPIASGDRPKMVMERGYIALKARYLPK